MNRFSNSNSWRKFILLFGVGGRTNNGRGGNKTDDFIWAPCRLLITARHYDISIIYIFKRAQITKMKAFDKGLSS